MQYCCHCVQARQYIACVPVGLSNSQAVFDDDRKFASHPYALVLEGGDQTLQVCNQDAPVLG